jgi:nickel transport protein
VKHFSHGTFNHPPAGLRVADFIRFVLLLNLLLVWLLPATAHDLQTTLRMEGRIAVLEATYEGEEEASFLAVSVQAPAEDAANSDAFQKGRTDFHGRFAFLPDRPGEWKITIDDEMGHRVIETFTVPATSLSSTVGDDADAAGPVRGEGGRSSTEKVLVGLSVLFGASGFLMAFLTRRRKTASV